MIAMENENQFLTDLTGKTVLVKTHGGAGTKDASLSAGDYRGVLLGFDGKFIKLECDTKRFAGGKGSMAKETIYINSAYTISVGEYISKEE